MMGSEIDSQAFIFIYFDPEIRIPEKHWVRELWQIVATALQENEVRSKLRLNSDLE